jgi:hypothetical protein
MYIHYDGSCYPNVFNMDQLSIERWLEDSTELDLTACVWMVPGTVDPND